MKDNNLIVAEDGIFPVTQDAEGKQLERLPASGLDLPGTIQGEGKLNGIPSLFIRLAGCNLHCAWKLPDGRMSGCDTAYASYQVRHAVSLPVETVCRIVLHNTEHLRHLVITGGEPLLQANPLNLLCIKMKEKRNFHITMETNATLFDENLAKHIDFFSLSPKLSTSVPAAPYTDLHEQHRIQPKVIQQFIDHSLLYKKDFQLKFVCSGERDVVEIKQLLDRLHGWKNEDILLMPLGCNSVELQYHAKDVLKFCIQNGWRYHDRLHITLFGNKAGV